MLCSFEAGGVSRCGLNIVSVPWFCSEFSVGVFFILLFAMRYFPANLLESQSGVPGMPLYP